MKILDDKIHVGHGYRDDAGQPLEPEEQPAARVIESVAEVDAGKHAQTVADALGHAPAMRMRVTQDMDALGAVEYLSRQCCLCRWWSVEAWDRDRRQLAQSGDGRRFLDGIRAQVLALDPKLASAADGDDPALNGIGRCAALSDLASAPIYTHPQACCPESGPGGEPLDDLFRPRDGATREPDKIRDRILGAASGASLTP